MNTPTNTKLLLFVLVFSSLVTSAHSQSKQDEPLRYTIEHQGKEKPYLVFLPAKFDPEKTYWPLIHFRRPHVNFETAESQRLQQEADRRGLDAIVIALVVDQQMSRAANTNFPQLGSDEILKQIVRDARSKYNLHEKILITGYSGGGQFAHRFALQNPDWVKAAAPFSSGSWTTPEGRFLRVGEERWNQAPLDLRPEEVETILGAHEQAMMRNVANIAGMKAQPGAEKIPFLVMCGSIDPRCQNAKIFAQSLKNNGYQVETDWPETDHSVGKPPYPNAESDKFTTGAIDFFLRMISPE